MTTVTISKKEKTSLLKRIFNRSRKEYTNPYLGGILLGIVLIDVFGPHTLPDGMSEIAHGQDIIHVGHDVHITLSLLLGFCQKDHHPNSHI